MYKGKRLITPETSRLSRSNSDSADKASRQVVGFVIGGGEDFRLAYSETYIVPTWKAEIDRPLVKTDLPHEIAAIQEQDFARISELKSIS